MRRVLCLAALALLLNSGASAYYHFVHFVRTAPNSPIPEAFQLDRLPDRTLPYFISESGPSAFAAGDSFPALISQIRLAARTWNDVPNSDLRIAFGGLTPAEAVQSGPAIDVVFDDDIPPGLIAYGGPTALGPDYAETPNGRIAPIAHSTVRLRRDLSHYPSYGEDFFLSLVHEFGHALGLQHTFTSSVMSTAVTRGTTKANPLAADDIAALSVLYPSAGFRSSTATVSGRVTAAGKGVNLASVVAIPSHGTAVSALTNPDGSYSIQGIPPGQYLVYVHPLPPPLPAEVTPGNVVAPKDASGDPIPPTGYFDTRFYPGTPDPGQAAAVILAAGESRDAVNFSVALRDAPAISSVTTYGYIGANAVHPAPLNIAASGATVVATGPGLLNGQTLTPGLSVRTLGGASVEAESVRFYTGAYMMFRLIPLAGETPGPRHLVFSTSTELYVLPSAFQLVASQPPSISTVTAMEENGVRVARVEGANLHASTRILFDGNAATVLRAGEDGSLTVSVPPAPAGHRAAVTAFNADGLSSLSVQPAPPMFEYSLVAAVLPSAVFISPQAVTAGTEVLVEITGVETGTGQVAVGAGSTGVVVRRVWVKEPGRVWANIGISPNAAAGTVPITVVAGLNVSRTEIAVIPSPKAAATTLPGLRNTLSGGLVVWPGVAAVLPIANIPVDSSLTVTLAGMRAQLLSVSTGQITFQIPPGASTGPAILRIANAGGEAAPPVALEIEAAPPSILGTTTASLRPGAVAQFIVSGISDPASLADPAMLRFNFGGAADANASAITLWGNYITVEVRLPETVPAGPQVPVTVTYAGSTSAPYWVSVTR